MENRELNLADLLGIALKRIWVIIAAMIIGGLAALYYTSFLITPKYQSVTKYLVDTTNLPNASSYYASTTASVEEQRNTVLSRLIVSSYIEILQTHNFTGFLEEKLKEKLAENPDALSHPYTSDMLFGNISYTFEEEKEFYLATVTADTAADAYVIAHCIEENSESYLVTKRANALNTLKVIDDARLNLAPVNVRYLLNIIIGVLLGAVLSFGIVFVIDVNDVRVKSEKELADAVGLPIIGTIPEISSARDSQSAAKRAANA